jgi:hypothetical protein
MTYRPGDIFVVKTGGWAAPWIRWFTRSWANHAAAIIAADGSDVEAQPHGAIRGNVNGYAGDRQLWGRPSFVTDEQAARFVVEAGKLAGTPYGWLDIASLALLRWGVRPGLVRRRVSCYDRLTCAELVDLAYQRAGVQLFNDGRQPLDVTPADLADLLLKENA